MNAELFIGDADGPELVIGRATDGTPLPDCRGWACAWCGTLFASRDQAEWCCTEPPLVVDGNPKWK